MNALLSFEKASLYQPSRDSSASNRLDGVEDIDDDSDDSEDGTSSNGGRAGGDHDDGRGVDGHEDAVADAVLEDVGFGDEEEGSVLEKQEEDDDEVERISLEVKVED